MFQFCLCCSFLIAVRINRSYFPAFRATTRRPLPRRAIRWRSGTAVGGTRLARGSAADSILLMRRQSPEIGSASEFARLRVSADPLEYERAARALIPADAWLELIREYPEMRFWAAHNKTVPVEILATLAGDPDPRVRRLVAMKRKATPEVLYRLAGDQHEGVRMAVAWNRRTPREVLIRLREDSW
jgi:hypothetical protein